MTGSVDPSPHWAATSDWLLACADPASLALVDGPARYTYRELRAAVRRVAAEFAALGVPAARVPEGNRYVLQPLGLPPVTIGNGSATTVIGGMLTDIAAWLAGRTPTLGSLRATAAADGVDLPELLPWPAGVPVTK